MTSPCQLWSALCSLRRLASHGARNSKAMRPQVLLMILNGRRTWRLRIAYLLATWGYSSHIDLFANFLLGWYPPIFDYIVCWLPLGAIWAKEIELLVYLSRFSLFEDELLCGTTLQAILRYFLNDVVLNLFERFFVIIQINCIVVYYLILGVTSLENVKPFWSGCGWACYLGLYTKVTPLLRLWLRSQGSYPCVFKEIFAWTVNLRWLKQIRFLNFCRVLAH